MRARSWLIIVVALSLAGIAACSPRRSSATIDVDPPVALAYFHAPGLPDRLQDIPLEYFATAARRLAAESGVGRGRVATLGYSRGTEAAMLAGAHSPS